MTSENPAPQQNPPSPGRRQEFRLESIVYRLTVSATGLLPFRWRGALVGRVLQAVFLASPRLRRRLRDSLAKALPALGSAERNAIQRKIPLNFGRTFIEVMHSRDLKKQSPYFHVSGAGFEALRQAQGQGRGAIIVMAHFGQWEAVRITMREAGMECGGFYRPQKKQSFDIDFLEVLRHFGEPIFAKGYQGTRDMIRYLRGGGFVGFMLDQNIQEAPLFDFFGLPAHTVTTAADLALKYDLLVVPAFGVRRKNTFEVDAVFDDPIPHTTPREMTQLINDRLEERIRANPDQWYWWYKRWRL